MVLRERRNTPGLLLFAFLLGFVYVFCMGMIPESSSWGCMSINDLFRNTCSKKKLTPALSSLFDKPVDRFFAHIATQSIALVLCTRAS
jgi:hypothetical protein